MKEDRAAPPAPAIDGLRVTAEERLRETEALATPAGTTESDVQRLLHELQVHQIELEMQNVELLRLQGVVPVRNLWDAIVGLRASERPGTVDDPPKTRERSVFAAALARTSELATGKEPKRLWKCGNRPLVFDVRGRFGGRFPHSHSPTTNSHIE